MPVALEGVSPVVEAVPRLPPVKLVPASIRLRERVFALGVGRARRLVVASTARPAHVFVRARARRRGLHLVAPKVALAAPALRVPAAEVAGVARSWYS